VVLLILAMVWAVVLGPSLLRRRAERKSTDSIGAFHRQLRILERTGPMIVDPAHRLGTEQPSMWQAPRYSASGLLVVRPDSQPANGLPTWSHGSRRPDPYFRPDACKRRRDILVSMLCVLVGTGLLGAIPTLRPLLYVTMVGAVFLASYVGLLVYLRNLAIEREVKLHYLPTPVQHESAVSVRRTAAH